MKAQHQNYPLHGESIGGSLTTQTAPDGTSHVIFEPNNRSQQKVDLQEFAQAPVGQPEGQWWQRGGRIYTPLIADPAGQS